jgi:Maintenance of mitochondrial structure and function
MLKGVMPMNVPLNPASSIKLMAVVNVLQTQASAIRMLQSRIDTIKQYLVDVADGNYSSTALIGL